MDRDERCGVVIVDKPSGMTSFDVVARMRRIYGTRRVGHTGTLDPQATGVLVVLVGRAAKAAEYISAGRKVYEAMLRLGVETDTEDIWGAPISTSDVIPSEDEVAEAASAFVGDIMQVPPMYSALKRGGVKLVDMARRGVEVEREPRPVSVYSLDVTKTDRTDEYGLRVVCSSGTYIRTLCADIGRALGCGGCMSSLRRHETCGYGLGAAKTMEQIESDPDAALMSVETLFSSLSCVNVAGADEKKVKNGVPLHVESVCDGRVRINDAGGFFALGEVKDGVLRVVKYFVL